PPGSILFAQLLSVVDETVSFGKTVSDHAIDDAGEYVRTSTRVEVFVNGSIEQFPDVRGFGIRRKRGNPLRRDFLIPFTTV
ncbi:MAG: hypothetical protein R3E76_15325, partial [Planctomycetota bacterium]